MNKLTKEKFNEACLRINTKILTPEGLKNIQDFKIGDEVLSYNLDIGEIEIKKVKATSKIKCYCWIFIRFDDSFEVYATRNHQFYDTWFNKWVYAVEISPTNNKDKLFGIKANRKGMYQKRIRCFGEYAYNIEVEDNHNYFLENGLLTSDLCRGYADVFYDIEE